MRPVNLIPPDERRGDTAPLRTGALIYVLIAGLGLLLLGVVAVALTGKQISDRNAEKASLEQQLTAATAHANNVRAFTDFRTVQENRAATVTSLAQSRFDWSRVLEELARTVPSDIHLDSLTGTVTPDVNTDSSGSSSSSGSSGGSNLRASIQGPALEIAGCAPSQDAVAGFVAALQDIDGVTRVGLDSSKAPDQSSSGFSGEPGNAPSTGGTGTCQDYSFTVVAAFDAVPTAGATPSTPPAVAAPPAATPTANDQVSDGQTDEAVATANERKQTSKASKAISTTLKGGN